MVFIKGFSHFRRLFLRPRISGFIVTGIGIMFVTFFTNNNSLELGISGIASIFIGIGVNNFTARETEQNDEKKLNRKTQQSIKTLQHIQAKIKKIKALTATDPQLINTELDEMCDYIELCAHYLEQE